MSLTNCNLYKEEKLTRSPNENKQTNVTIKFIIRYHSFKKKVYNKVKIKKNYHGEEVCDADHGACSW